VRTSARRSQSDKFTEGNTESTTLYWDVWLILVILLTVAGLIMDSPYLTAAALLLFI